jgi:hypothetical protein
VGFLTLCTGIDARSDRHSRHQLGTHTGASFRHKLRHKTKAPTSASVCVNSIHRHQQRHHGIEQNLGRRIDGHISFIYIYTYIYCSILLVFLRQPTLGTVVGASFGVCQKNKGRSRQTQYLCRHKPLCISVIRTQAPTPAPTPASTRNTNFSIPALGTHTGTQPCRPILM